MKKIASILLFASILATLFYNALGYHMLFAFEEEQEWVTAMKKIPDSEFKVIHLNASLYTFVDDTELEFVNENIVINNKTYHIFKKRIQNNLLSLYYLPNINSDLTSQEIENLIDGQLFNSSNGTKSASKKSVKSFSIDYFIQYPEIITALHKSILNSSALNLCCKKNIVAGYFSVFYSPPDFA